LQVKQRAFLSWTERGGLPAQRSDGAISSHVFFGRLTMMRCGSLLLALVITLTSLGAAAQQQPATAPPPATPPAVSPAPAQPDQSLLKPEQIEAWSRRLR
jgi:hypothetical protein